MFIMDILKLLKYDFFFQIINFPIKVKRNIIIN